MLISYPILPIGADNQSEDDRLNAMLALTQRDRGLYPVTTGNRWHGGIHLTPGDEPIRAIADGVIVAYRLAPDTKEYTGQGSYDTSFVLIKHETESGENTPVVFYSLYMHLRPKGLLSNAQRQQLAAFLRDAATGDDAVQAPANTRIWRKEVLGFGGQLYGVPTVHFEIFATEADFNAFWRDSATVAAGNHGSDDVFGDMHFIIPANQSFADRHPRAIAPHRIDLPGANAFYELDTGQAGQNAERLQVMMNLSGGTRTATTYRLDAQGRLGARIGDPVVQTDYEYELYRLATALYPDCPSAGFEYLRFGRILGPDTTTRVENWQLIRYSATEMGYINLADPTNQVSILSDADFPMRWQRLEEGQAASPTDGMANVEELTRLLQLPAQPSAASLSGTADFATRTHGVATAEKLAHFICRHPSEWDASDLDSRYAALRDPGNPLHNDTAWVDFKNHVEKMAFWPQTGIADRSVWHFHPLQFIRHYRVCGWLNRREFLRCIPARYQTEQERRGTPIVQVNLTTATAGARVDQRDPIAFFWVCRKYGLNSRIRLAHFLPQIFRETGVLRWPEELASGAGYEGRTDLGNVQTGDGRRFKGRGLIQTTGRANYAVYSRYRGKSGVDAYTSEPNNLLLATDAYTAADAAGTYWASRDTGQGLININRLADSGISENELRRVTRNVNGAENGPWTGLLERRSHLQVTKFVLLDEVIPISPERARTDV